MFCVVFGGAPETFVVRVGITVRCTVVFGVGALERISEFLPAAPSSVFVVGDKRVLSSYRGRIMSALDTRCICPVHTVPFTAGEPQKNRRTLARLTDRLIDLGADRHSAIVAVGGGVSTDLVGFAAATLLRGVALLNVPTTIIGMVDAAIGGKTGVDTPKGKNLLGAIHWPLAVVVDPSFLRSLPQSEVATGLAEVIKHGVIMRPQILAMLEEAREYEIRAPFSLTEVLLPALQVKVDVVNEDPYEAGLRHILNFGHTVGHAVEAATDYGITHGEAVAWGMLVEGLAANELVGFPVEQVERIRELLRKCGLLSCSLPPYSALVPHLNADKKKFRNRLFLALPTQVGKMARGDGRYLVEADKGVLERCFHEVVCNWA